MVNLPEPDQCPIPLSYNSVHFTQTSQSSPAHYQLSIILCLTASVYHLESIIHLYSSVTCCLSSQSIILCLSSPVYHAISSSSTLIIYPRIVPIYISFICSCINHISTKYDTLQSAESIRRYTFETK